MAKIELKTEELIGLLQQMQGDAIDRPAPVSDVMGQETPRRGAEESLGMLQTLRAARPAESPVAAGTITQTRRHSEEQAKLQREQMAQQERLAAAARAAARAGRARGPAAPQGIHAVAGAIRAMSDRAINEGRPFKDLEQTLNNELLLGYFHQHGVKPGDALELAKTYYSYGLEGSGFGRGTLGSLPQMYNEVQQPVPRGVLPHQSPAIDYLKSAFAALQPMKQLPGLREAATQDWAKYQTFPEDKKLDAGPGTIYQRNDGSTYKYDVTGKLVELSPPTHGPR